MNRTSGLSAWHLTFLAVGTVIGGSFFLGSAIAIRNAGPASLLSFLLGGLFVYIILAALSEMTTADPKPGSFRTYAAEHLGPWAGFLVGWVYWSGLTLGMSSEAIAVSVLLRTWLPGISLPLLASVIVIAVTLLNLLSARALSQLESMLAGVKLAAVAGFVVLAVVLVAGLLPGRAPIGFGQLLIEPLWPRGIAGVAGSMLIVMFAYAGFEVLGLAATEARDPQRQIPKAIALTTLILVGLYVAAIGFLMPLIPTSALRETVSPFVAALQAHGMTWAARTINGVLITAILSTMLAAMFGLGRMIRSLAQEGDAPPWLYDKAEAPQRGILFTGVAMLAGVALGFLLPRRIYLFLVSSGGFAMLVSYLSILLAHRRFRAKHGCPPQGHCQLVGFPYTSWLGIAGLTWAITSMPLIPGQASGLLAGLTLIGLFSAAYGLTYKRRRGDLRSLGLLAGLRERVFEAGQEWDGAEAPPTAQAKSRGQRDDRT